MADTAIPSIDFQGHVNFRGSTLLKFHALSKLPPVCFSGMGALNKYMHGLSLFV